MADDSHTAFSFFNNTENSTAENHDALVNTKESKADFKRLIVCTISAFLTLVTVFLPGLTSLVDVSLKTIFTIISAIVSFKVYKKAVKDVFKKKITAEVMLGTCSLVSFIFAILTGFYVFENAILINSDFYFVVTVINLWAMLLGTYVKSLLKNRSADAYTKLNDFVPDKVKILSDDTEKIVDLQSVCKGDCTIVLSGEKIPFDGVVVCGKTMVDESILTGKDVPVSKSEGDIVYAGGINKYGEIKIQSLHSGKESLLFKLIQSAKKEIENGPEIKSITERTAEKYLVFITLISACIGGLFAGLHFSLVDALLFAVMTFILSCPVAFAFTEPLLLAGVVVRANKEKILFRNPEVITLLNNSDTFAFDKSGILLSGEFVVTDIHPLGDFSEDEILKYCASVESVMQHPISDAIFDYTFSKEIPAEIPKEVEILADGGVKAVISDKNICFGNPDSFDNEIFGEYADIYIKFKKEEKLIAYLTVDSIPAAIIAAKDSYKTGAVEFMNYLSDANIEIHSFVDDSPGHEIESNEHFPDARVAKIKALKKKGKTVVMIGDGINDALAFASADVAISVGSTNSVAIDTSDVIVLSDDFSDILKAVNIGNSYKKIAKQNIISAMLVNFILLVGAFTSIFSGYFYLGPEVLVAALISILNVFVNTRRIMSDK